MITATAIEGEYAPGQWRDTNFNLVSAGYFDVMGIRLARGRIFTESEAARGDAVAVIREAMAKAYWGGEDPRGRRFTYGLPERLTGTFQVVGVVKDVRSIHIWEDDGPLFYLPPDKKANLQIVVWAPSTGFPLNAESIRQMVRVSDPAVLTSVRTLADNVEHQATASRLGVALAGLLGGLALTLASVGIYGIR